MENQTTTIHNHPVQHNQSTSNKPDRVSQMMDIQEQALNLFKRKNADYGDAFATFGVVGVLVRMGDKLSRLASITNRGITLVNDESLRDTLMDLHNYSAMAMMLLDEDENEGEEHEEEKSKDE
jgi:hypothetical protein